MKSLSKFNFLHDHVLVKAKKEDSSTGLIKPDQYEDKSELGEVVAVGKGRILENGKIVPMTVKPGDTILFGKYSTEKIRFGGEDYLILREEDIIAIQ